MPTDQGRRRNPRQPNTIDVYSLLLQIIQVYPVVLGAAAVVSPVRWLRILIATAGLVIVTLWAFVHERATARPPNPAPDDGDAADDGEVPEGGIVPGRDAAPSETDPAEAPDAPPADRRTHGRPVNRWRHPSEAARPRRVQRLYQRPVPPRSHGPIAQTRSEPHHKPHDTPEKSDDPGHETGIPLRRATRPG